MTLEQAQRILSEPKYVRALIAEAIEEITRRTWDDPVVNTDTLLRRKAVVEGLRIADNFFAQAQAVVAGSLEEAARLEKAKLDAVLPVGLAAAMVEPVRRGGE